jgi:hypothetical protein
MAVDVSGVTRLVREHGRTIAESIGSTFVNKAQGLAPRRTGAGADSIAVEAVDDNGDVYVVRIVVGEVYMKYQNEGTGIYGPEGTPIVPRNARVLVFDSAIMGGLVFAPSVKGTEPTHWWDRTIDAWPEIVREAGR